MKMIVPAALGGLLALSGCASVPPLNFAPANVGMSQTKQDAALVAVTVTVAAKSEAKGKIQIAGAEGNVAELWKTALEDAITRMAVFRDDSPHRLSLAVKILKLQLPVAGVAMHTKTTARYELIDRNTGAIVFASDVESDGRSGGGENFYGAIRARISASNSVQNNIATFLQQLETADLSKPVFPAARQVQAGK